MKWSDRIAQGFSPGERSHWGAPESGARNAACSIPDVAFVEGNSMAFHDFANFRLIAELFVMVGLVEDIVGNGFYI